MSSYQTRTSAIRAHYDNGLAHAAFGQGLGRAVSSAFGYFERKRRERIAAAHLSVLSDHYLADIGIDRASIADVVTGQQNLKDRLGR